MPRRTTEVVVYTRLSRLMIYILHVMKTLKGFNEMVTCVVLGKMELITRRGYLVIQTDTLSGDVVAVVSPWFSLFLCTLQHSHCMHTLHHRSYTHPILLVIFCLNI